MRSSPSPGTRRRIGAIRGGAFSQLMKDKRAPDVLVLLRQGKEFGDLKIWACSMALDVAGLEMDHLVEELFDADSG